MESYRLHSNPDIKFDLAGESIEVLKDNVELLLDRADRIVEDIHVLRDAISVRVGVESVLKAIETQEDDGSGSAGFENRM